MFFCLALTLLSFLVKVVEDPCIILGLGSQGLALRIYSLIAAVVGRPGKGL